MVKMVWFYICEKFYDKNKILQVGLLFQSMDVKNEGYIEHFSMIEYLERF